MLDPMLAQIHSLPDLMRQLVEEFDVIARTTWDHELCLSLKRIFLVGCGDSHHAPLGSELAFEQLAGLPCEPMTAMHFARYTAPDLRVPGPKMVGLVGVSVSGRVARTIEAVRLGGLVGATTIALSGSSDTPLAQAAERIFEAKVPPFEITPEMRPVKVVPGLRSFLASLVGLWLSAIRIGEVRGHLTTSQADAYRRYLYRDVPEALAATIQACQSLAQQLAEDWQDAAEFICCGSGPGFAAALFSAAKILEASGDPALGQDMEEWAHLQYFAHQPDTPTFLISAGQRDASRIPEICTAAKRIGRRVAAIVPAHQTTQLAPTADIILPIIHDRPIPELFWTILGVIPGSLFAAYRSLMLNEPPFRDFGGGREFQAGGGISRIQTSEQWQQLPNE
jgi:glucosamine--fructose-6-phosphate aminotransferase (isomerizing)